MGTSEENPFKSIAAAITFSPYDFSENHRLAWIYGIAIGWGDYLPEIAERFGWDADTAARLTRLRGAFQHASTEFNEGLEQ